MDQIAEQAEARSVAFTDMDVTKNGRAFEGYAGVYGQEFDAGKFIETMLPPMFRSAIGASPNVPMLWHHNDQFPPFATTGGGTLHLSEDRRGLRVRVDEIDERHILGPTLISMLERGEVRGMSVGMVVGSGNQKLTQRNGRVHRAITGLKKLLDVSPTWEPAYEGTRMRCRRRCASTARTASPARRPPRNRMSSALGPATTRRSPRQQGDAACNCSASNCRRAEPNDTRRSDRYEA
jgi:HK97 family phage prohead protease